MFFHSNFHLNSNSCHDHSNFQWKNFFVYIFIFHLPFNKEDKSNLVRGCLPRSVHVCMYLIHIRTHSHTRLHTADTLTLVAAPFRRLRSKEFTGLHGRAARVFLYAVAFHSASSISPTLSHAIQPRPRVSLALAPLGGSPSFSHRRRRGITTNLQERTRPLKDSYFRLGIIFLKKGDCSFSTALLLALDASIETDVCAMYSNKYKSFNMASKSNVTFVYSCRVLRLLSQALQNSFNIMTVFSLKVTVYHASLSFPRPFIPILTYLSN